VTTHDWAEAKSACAGRMLCRRNKFHQGPRCDRIRPAVIGDFPERFGPYVLLRSLGRGGMGTVALAIFGSAGAEKLCVVKRLLPEHRGRADFVRRFRDEAELVRRLSHGNLVETYAVGEIEGEPFIAQAFVEGHDLSEVVLRAEEKGESFSVPLAVYIVRELARGLAFAHDFENLNLVHRDINPPNVRLTYGGEVKLLDFGLATSLLKRQMTEPGSQWGKVAYMAPEQMQDGAIDRRADIYVLGVLLWELVTGDRTHGHADEMPVPEDFGAALARLALRELPPASRRNPQVPTALDTVIAKAAAPSRDDRFVNAGELRAALMPFLPTDFDAEAALANLLGRLFKREREKAERDHLVEESRHLLSMAAPIVTLPGVGEADAMIGGQILVGERVEGADDVDLRTARNRTSHQPLLILTAPRIYTPELGDKLRAAATHLRAIDVAEVVSVNEVGATDDGKLFLAMDYFAGVDLRGWVRSGQGPPISRQQVLRIGIQICRALEGIRPIVRRHGSVDQPGRVLISQASREGAQEPTVRLSGAEIVIRAAGLSPDPTTSDVRGVGKLLQDLLTGADRDDSSMFRPGERPEVIGSILDRALADGYATIGELRKALLAVVASQGRIGATPIPPAARPKTTTRPIVPRRRVVPLAMFAGAVGILLVAALAGPHVKRRPFPGSGTPPVQRPDLPPAVATPRPVEPLRALTPEPPIADPVGVGEPDQPLPKAGRLPEPSHPNLARHPESAPVSKPPGQESAAELVAKARLAFASDALDEALRDAERASRAGAGADAQVVIGNVYLKRSDYRAAEKAFAEALRLDPSDEKAARRLDRVRVLLENPRK
jgi:serine/threonine protein kinase